MSDFFCSRSLFVHHEAVPECLTTTLNSAGCSERATLPVIVHRPLQARFRVQELHTRQSARGNTLHPALNRWTTRFPARLGPFAPTTSNAIRPSRLFLPSPHTCYHEPSPHRPGLIGRRRHSKSSPHGLFRPTPRRSPGCRAALPNRAFFSSTCVCRRLLSF